MKETLREPSVGLFIMGGRDSPPSAVLGREPASSLRENMADIVEHSAHNRKFEVFWKAYLEGSGVDGSGSITENGTSMTCASDV